MLWRMMHIDLMDTELIKQHDIHFFLLIIHFQLIHIRQITPSLLLIRFILFYVHSYNQEQR